MPSKGDKLIFVHVTRILFAKVMWLLLFLLISSTSLPAQSNSVRIRTQYMNWTGFQIKYKYGHWSGSAEIQNRIFLDPLRQDALLIPRINILRKMNSRISTGGGMAFFLHGSPSVPDEAIRFWNAEFRPHIELHYKPDIHHIEIAARLRLEGRIIQRQEINTGQRYYSMTERGRIRIWFGMPLNQKIRFIVSEEFFAKHSPGDFIEAEENRLRTGFDLKLSKGSEVSIEYMHVYRNFIDNNPIQRHTLVLDYSLHVSPK